jgi:hypothetical protein
MATLRMYRGHWVADYYDANKRRRIERPRGHFENLTDQLRAAQALLADRVAEVADGLVHEGYGTFEDAANRWLNSKVAIRPTSGAVTSSYFRAISCPILAPARSA